MNRTALRRFRLSAAAAVTLPTALLVVTAPAAAAQPALPAECEPDGAQVVCTYDEPGEHTFTGPEGVTEVVAEVHGAQGGGRTGVGGLGGSATATIPIDPAETLIVTVGGEGGAIVQNQPGGAGGFNGGAAGGDGATPGGGGGGSGYIDPDATTGGSFGPATETGDGQVIITNTPPVPDEANLAITKECRPGHCRPGRQRGLHDHRHERGSGGRGRAHSHRRATRRADAGRAPVRWRVRLARA